MCSGCKFDLRLYVLVTSFHPLKVWLAREGFARLSGERFSLTRIDDCRIHLTNMSIQLRAGPRPVGDAPQEEAPPVKLGRKWPLTCLRQYLANQHGQRAVDELLQNIAGQYAKN